MVHGDGFTVIDDWKNLHLYEDLLNDIRTGLHVKWQHHQTLLGWDTYFFSHTLCGRIEQNDFIPHQVSKLFIPLQKMVYHFLIDHEIPFECIGRSNLNLTYPQEGQPPAHMDHAIPYIQLLYYFDDIEEGGETVLFDQRREYTGRMQDTVIENGSNEGLKIKELIPSKKGRFLLFDGRYMHTSNFPKTGARMLLVNTIFTPETFDWIQHNSFEKTFNATYGKNGRIE